MKKSFLNNILILISLFLVLGSCSKYDEGPYLSLYGKEKRVLGRWYFSTVKYNDIDSTDSYRYDPMQTIEFYQNTEKGALWNAYTWNVNSGTSGNVSYGAWRFNDEKDSIEMVTTLTNYGGGVVATDTTWYKWKINRLAYTEFWMQRQVDDTTLLRWKLWKIAY